jgi:hypothetical protein
MKPPQVFDQNPTRPWTRYAVIETAPLARPAGYLNTVRPPLRGCATGWPVPTYSFPVTLAA